MTIDDYLAVPYVLQLDSVLDESGKWVRQAAYPELGIVVQALSPLEAIDLIERERVAVIRARLERGEPVPVPRAPLRPLERWRQGDNA